MKIRSILFLFVISTVVLLSGCGGDSYESANKKYKSGNYEQARVTIENVIAQSPTAKSHLLAFDIYSKLENNGSAISHMIGALSALHDNITPETWQVEYPDLKEQMKAAQAILCPMHETQWGRKGYDALDFVFGDYEFNSMMLIATVYKEIAPEDPYWHLLFAQGLHLKGEFGRAYNFYVSYLNHFPEDIWAVKWKADMMRETADWQINDMYQREDWRQQYYARAVRGYDIVIAKMPKEASVYYSKALAYMFNDNVDMGVRVLNKTLEVNPKFAPAHFDLGVILNRTGRQEPAFEHFTKAIEADPDFPEPYYHRGYIYFVNKNEPLKAKADLEMTVKLCPGSSDAWCLLGDVCSKLALGYLRLGLFYHEYDPTTFTNWDKAKPCCERSVEAFTEALAIEPENHNAYYRRADAYGMMAKWKECYADLEMAIKYGKKEDPQYYLYTYTLGKFYQWAGHHKIAFDHFEKTWELFAYLCKYEGVQDGKIKKMTDPLTLDAEQGEVFACIGGSWRFSSRYEPGAEYSDRYRKFSSNVTRGSGFGFGGRTLK